MRLNLLADGRARRSTIPAELHGRWRRSSPSPTNANILAGPTGPDGGASRLRRHPVMYVVAAVFAAYFLWAPH